MSQSVAGFSTSSMFNVRVAVGAGGSVIATYYGDRYGVAQPNMASVDGVTASDQWTVAYDTAGSLIWSKPFGGKAIATDAATYAIAFQLGPTTLPASTGSYMFLARFTLR